jgi:hypothetical protein
VVHPPQPLLIFSSHLLIFSDATAKNCPFKSMHHAHTLPKIRVSEVKDTQVSILHSSLIRMGQVAHQVYRRTNHTKFYRPTDTHT